MIREVPQDVAERTDLARLFGPSCDVSLQTRAKGMCALLLTFGDVQAREEALARGSVRLRGVSYAIVPHRSKGSGKPHERRGRSNRPRKN